jgi:hypothetical protein
MAGMDPVTAEMADLVREAEDVASITWLHREASKLHELGAVQISGRDYARSAQLLDRTAQLLLRLATRLHAIESQQIGRALRRSEPPRDPGFHD